MSGLMRKVRPRIHIWWIFLVLRENSLRAARWQAKPFLQKRAKYTLSRRTKKVINISAAIRLPGRNNNSAVGLSAMGKELIYLNGVGPENMVYNQFTFQV